MHDKPTLLHSPDAQQIDAYRSFRKNIVVQQEDQQKQAKVDASQKVIAKILEGKRKKLIKSGVLETEIVLDAKQVLEEIREGCVFNIDNALIQIPTQYVQFGNIVATGERSRQTKQTQFLITYTFVPVGSISQITSPTSDIIPDISSSLEYRVYKDLWLRGKFVTNGDSFGGDYLVYPGDPMYYHASHIVHCVPNEITATQLVCGGRLAVLVNKLCVFATQDATTGEILYETIEWEGNSSDRNDGANI